MILTRKGFVPDMNPSLWSAVRRHVGHGRSLVALSLVRQADARVFWALQTFHLARFWRL
jgi:hypothetical protein